MNQLIEQHCKGTFRSFKTFRTNGQVVLHTLQEFQEWDFDDTRTLRISTYKQQRRKVQVETNAWTLSFNNKRHYIEVAQPLLRLELLSVNHTGLVVEDSTRGEKIFFARLPVWERLIRERLPLF